MRRAWPNPCLTATATSLSVIGCAVFSSTLWLQGQCRIMGLGHHELHHSQSQPTSSTPEESNDEIFGEDSQGQRGSRNCSSSRGSNAGTRECGDHEHDKTRSTPPHQTADVQAYPASSVLPKVAGSCDG